MGFPLGLSDFLISQGIIILASLLQASIGFGLGLLAVPLLILIEPAFVPGPVLLAAMLLNIMVSYRERHAVDYYSLKWVTPGRLVGTIVGALTLKFFPPHALSLLFGTLVLLGVGMSTSGIHLPLTRANFLGIGTLSGFMGTTTAIGGPPLALLFQNEGGPRIRATLGAIFLIGTIMAIISLIFINRFGVRETLLAVVSFPSVLLGFLLSFKTTHLLDKGFMRLAVLITSALFAVYLIVQNI